MQHFLHPPPPPLNIANVPRPFLSLISIFPYSTFRPLLFIILPPNEIITLINFLVLRPNLKNFEQLLKFTPQLKYDWFHLKVY